MTVEDDDVDDVVVDEDAPTAVLWTLVLDEPVTTPGDEVEVEIVPPT